MSAREEIRRLPTEELPGQLAQERDRLAGLELELSKRPGDAILQRRIRRAKSVIQELADQIAARGPNPPRPR